MATIERFKEALSKGKVFTDGASLKLDAQMKYDYLAAIHSMDQLENLAKTFKERAKKHDNFRTKLITNCRNALKTLVEDENALKELKNIEHAIKLLNDCRTELIKLDAQDHEANKLSKVVQDGVSAGR